jgi:hypothetical protein
MTEPSLQVTYRKGRTFAAYLHLSHPTGERSARTVASPDGLLIIDNAASGRPLGVEITAPQAVPLNRLNQLLAEIGEPPLTEQDYRPARTAWSASPLQLTILADARVEGVEPLSERKPAAFDASPSMLPVRVFSPSSLARSCSRGGREMSVVPIQERLSSPRGIDPTSCRCHLTGPFDAAQLAIARGR